MKEKKKRVEAARGWRRPPFSAAAAGGWILPCRGPSLC